MARGIAEWVRDEALRAKTEAEFAKTEPETSKDKVEEEAYDVGVANTQAVLKAQIPGVCRLYCFQVWNEALKQAGVEASSNLWKTEKVYYPPAIRETSSETASAPEEAEVAQPEVALTVSPTNEPAKGGELPKVTGTGGSSNPEAPQEATGSVVSAQDPHAEEPPLLIQPLQSISPTDVTQSLEANPAQLPKEGDVSQGLEANPIRLPKEGAKVKLKK